MATEERSLVNLAEMIEGYTQAQLELLQCVRQLRAQLKEGSSSLGTAPASRTAVVTEPTSSGPSTDSAAPIPANAALIEAITASTTSSVSHPRNDYDYFTELDRKLAALEAKLEEGLTEDVQRAEDAQTT